MDREEFLSWKNGPEAKAAEAHNDAVKDSINAFMEERANHPSFTNKESFEKIQSNVNRGIMTGDETLKAADQMSEGFFSIYHERRLGAQFDGLL